MSYHFKNEGFKNEIPKYVKLGFPMDTFDV